MRVCVCVCVCEREYVNEKWKCVCAKCQQTGNRGNCMHVHAGVCYEFQLGKLCKESVHVCAVSSNKDRCVCLCLCVCACKQRCM